MLYASLKTLHLLSIVIWVGGMFFAHFFLRPAVAGLDAPVRLKLLHGVMKPFLGLVTYLSLLTLFTGLWMIGNVAKTVVQAGGTFDMPLDWTLMAVLGTLMVLIFGHIRFALFGRFQKAVQAEDWSAAGTAMGTLRQWVFVNLCIGLVTIVVTLLT